MTPESLIARLQAALLELQVKGIPPTIALSATKRALRMARGNAACLSEPIREQGFSDMLEFQLRHSEDWCRGVVRARDDGSYAAGMARAARDDRWGQGMRRQGLTVGAKTRRAWGEAQTAAVEGWEGQ